MRGTHVLPGHVFAGTLQQWKGRKSSNACLAGKLREAARWGALCSVGWVARVTSRPGLRRQAAGTPSHKGNEPGRQYVARHGAWQDMWGWLRRHKGADARLGHGRTAAVQGTRDVVGSLPL